MDNIIIIIIAEWSGEKLEKGDNGGEHVDWNGICIDDGLDFFLFFLCCLCWVFINLHFACSLFHFILIIIIIIIIIISPFLVWDF